MSKKEKKQNILKKIKGSALIPLRFLGTKTWFLTSLFFITVLVASVLVWWQCVYKPKPSGRVLAKIEREKEDFDDMKKKTKEAITLLQGYRNNYNNPSKFESQRELFVDVLDEEVVRKIEEERVIQEELETQNPSPEESSEGKQQENKEEEIVTETVENSIGE